MRAGPSQPRRRLVSANGSGVKRSLSSATLKRRERIENARKKKEADAARKVKDKVQKEAVAAGLEPHQYPALQAFKALYDRTLGINSGNDYKVTLPSSFEADLILPIIEHEQNLLIHSGTKEEKVSFFKKMHSDIWKSLNDRGRSGIEAGLELCPRFVFESTKMFVQLMPDTGLDQIDFNIQHLPTLQVLDRDGATAKYIIDNTEIWLAMDDDQKIWTNTALRIAENVSNNETCAEMVHKPEWKNLPADEMKHRVLEHLSAREIEEKRLKAF